MFSELLKFTEGRLLQNVYIRRREFGCAQAQVRAAWHQYYSVFIAVSQLLNNNITM